MYALTIVFSSPSKLTTGVPEHSIQEIQRIVPSLAFEQGSRWTSF
jgi:hypothetical protein